MNDMADLEADSNVKKINTLVVPWQLQHMVVE